MGFEYRGKRDDDSVRGTGPSSAAPSWPAAGGRRADQRRPRPADRPGHGVHGQPVHPAQPHEPARRPRRPRPQPPRRLLPRAEDHRGHPSGLPGPGYLSGLGSAALAVVLLLWLGFTQGTVWTWITTAIAAVSPRGDRRERPGSRAGPSPAPPSRWPAPSRRTSSRSTPTSCPRPSSVGCSEHRERLEQRADPADHDRRGAGVHAHRAALHRLDVLDLPQAAWTQHIPGPVAVR